MRQVCPACGHEYEIGSFRFDSGCCPACRPSFGSLAWLNRTRYSVQQLFLTLLVIHAFYLFFLSLLLCCSPTLSGLTIYATGICLYLLGRLLLGLIAGYPQLRQRQEAVLLTMPLWGPLSLSSGSH